MNSYPARGTHRFRVIALGTALLIGGAMGFAGGQGVAAASCVDGGSMIEVYYELPYEQGRPVVSPQTDCESEKQESVQAANEPVGRHCTFFHDIGGPPYVDEICAAIDKAAETEARGWPDFDSTSLGDKAKAVDAEQAGGYYVIVGEDGHVYSPEAESAGTTGQGAVTDAGSLPDYGHTANGRSIALIESKEAPTEFAQSPRRPF